MDTVQGITKSAAQFFSGTALSRVTGLARDISMAAAFGAEPTVAAFFMAFRFANLPRRMLGEGTQTAVVPRFEELRQESPARAHQFFRDLSISLLIVVAVLVFLIESVLRGILGHGVSEGNEQIIRLTMTLLPALGFITLYGLNQALLNCEKIYFLPGVAPALFNIGWVCLIFFLWGSPVEEAMPILAGGLVAAFALQWLVTAPSVWSRMRGAAGFWRPFSPDVRRLAKPLLLGIIGVTAMQINSALDLIFARIADPSGPAYLWCAMRLQQLPLALFGISLYGALLPPLSRAVKAGNHERAAKFKNHVMRRVLIVMTLCTLGILVLGQWAVELIYEHGRFSPEDSIITTRCLWAYAVGLVPGTMIFIEAAACYAAGNYRRPAIATALAVLFNIGCSVLFVYGFGWGAFSVALATSAASFVHLSLLRRGRSAP